MRRKTVSVVIAAYNAEGFLPRCLDSVFAQDYPDTEVIVVDDASTDRTGDIVKSSRKPVQYIRLDRNSGPAFARTIGIRASTGAYLAFLDADDYWLPGFSGTTIGFLEKHPQAVAVYTGYYFKKWGDDSLNPSEIERNDRQVIPEGGAVLPDFFRFWAKYMNVLTGSVMMRAETVRQTGGQRPDLRLTEDFEFWAYLSTFGAVGYVPVPLFVTDQCAITPRQRLAKMKRRFSFFKGLTVEAWESRVRERLSPEQEDAFRRILSHVATSIAIANAYSGDHARARRIALRWREDLTPGIGSALKLGLRLHPALWPLVCRSIKAREHVKAYSPTVAAWLAGQARKRMPF